MSGSRESMQKYYDTRAPEYDHAYTGEGVWTFEDAPGLSDEIPEIQAFVASLPPATTLDVACGTGFLTRFLRGDVMGVDFSLSMLGVARSTHVSIPLVQGDALALPFADGAFERVFSSHFYGRLRKADRLRFLAEARRVAGELILLDTPFRGGRWDEGIEERRLLDGRTFEIYKKYFRPDELMEEMGGGRVLLATEWFLVATNKE